MLNPSSEAQANAGSDPTAAAGTLVPTFVHRWQFEDGVTLRRGEHVSWLLELYNEDIARWPALVTTLTGEAEPVSFGTGPTTEHATLIHTGRFTAYYRAREPLNGPVRLAGILTPDWYGRTHDALPPTQGTVVRLLPVHETQAAQPTGRPWDGPGVATVDMHLNPEMLGVRVDLRLDPTA